MREKIVSSLITASSRGLLLRDRLIGRLPAMLKAFPFEAERVVFASGGRRLAAVYVSAGEEAPVFLVCHGIGERIEYWAEVQGLLREMGVSSLVFNYTGFGASAGRTDVASCEEDAIAAYRMLKERGAWAVFLLGYSLGTGVAAAVATKVDVAGMILCEGFTSLCEAAACAGMPWFVARFGRGIWQTAKRVEELEVPVLVVHSDGDELFPVAMAEEIARGCGARGEKIVIEGMGHNEPIFEAPVRYWRPVVEWAMRCVSASQR